VKLNKIGSGSYGNCCKVKRKKDEKIFLLKAVSTKAKINYLETEVNLLRELNSPHIVRYIDYFHDTSTSTFNIVMEYCEMGDLQKMILHRHRLRLTDEKAAYFEEPMVWRIFYQMNEALKACHTRKPKVLHRDIKPANVFFDHNHDVKLGDFGLAKVVTENDSAKTWVGSPFCMAPEIDRKKTVYDEKCDIYSLGCTLQLMCSLRIPLRGKISFDRIPEVYTDDLDTLIKCLVKTDPKDRPSASEISKDPRFVRGTAKVEKEMLSCSSQSSSKSMSSSSSSKSSKDYKNLWRTASAKLLPKHPKENKSSVAKTLPALGNLDGPLPRCRSVCAYSDNDPRHLNFKEGDEITIVETNSTGWLLGYLRGMLGLIPINLVKVTEV